MCQFSGTVLHVRQKCIKRQREIYSSDHFLQFRRLEHFLLVLRQSSPRSKAGQSIDELLGLVIVKLVIITVQPNASPKQPPAVCT